MSVTITSVPKKVEPDKKKAFRALRDTGLTEDQAKRRLSKVYAVRDSGIAIVGSYANSDGGPLGLSFFSGPWYGCGVWGLLLRVGCRAERAKPKRS